MSVFVVAGMPCWAPAVFGQIFRGPDLESLKSLVVMLDGRFGATPFKCAGIVTAVVGDLVYVATAYHCRQRGDILSTGLRVRFRQEQSETVAFPAEHFRGGNEDDDLAVLQVRAKGLSFQMNRLANTALEEGSKVYVVGYPNGHKWEPTYLPSAVQGYEKNPPRLLIQDTVF